VRELATLKSGGPATIFSGIFTPNVAPWPGVLLTPVAPPATILYEAYFFVKICRHL
jgi:hypothetical protein